MPRFKTIDLLSWLRIRNWPFAVKIGLAPFFAMILLLIVVRIGQTGIETQHKSFNRVVNQNMEGSIELALIINDLYSINGQFYRLTSVIAIGDNSLDVPTEFDKLRSAVDALLTRIERYKNTFQNAELLPTIIATQKRLEEYKVQVDLVSSFIEVDFAGAINAISRFDAEFLSLAHNLQNNLNAATADSRSQSIKAGVEASYIGQFFNITSAAAVVIAVLIAFFIGRAIVASIVDIAAATQRIAMGEQNVDISQLKRSDELQEIVNSLHKFRRFMDELHRAQQEKSQARRIFQEQKMAALRRMAASIDQEADKVVSVVSLKAGGMERAAQDMTATAQRITQQSHDSTRAALDAMQTAETVAAAAIELSTSIDSIAKDINQSHLQTELAVEKTTEAMKVVDSLSIMASQIGGVIKLISAIAHQTNMLALNATIEAARAGGEVGKGFAVVAYEVNLLANQTAAATQEISTKVKAIQAATIEAHDSFNHVTESIQELGEISNAIAASIDEQRASTEEIATAIHIAADKSRDVTERMGRLDIEVERTCQVADTVKKVAGELSDEVVFLGQTLSGIVRDATEEQAQNSGVEDEIAAMAS